MRGHWISQTRKLNKHYQNGGPADKAAGMVIEQISVLNRWHMPFLWRVDHSGARKLKLGLACNTSINLTTGIVSTLGRLATVIWDETLNANLEDYSDWVLVDFIPYFKMRLYYGNDISGVSSLLIDLSDEEIFEINTGKLMTTCETLEFSNFDADFVKAQFRVPPNYYTTDERIIPQRTFSLRGVCVWIKKSEMTYRAQYNEYRINAAPLKAILDEVEFDIEFKQKNPLSFNMRCEFDGMSYPYQDRSPYQMNSYGLKRNNISKTYSSANANWGGSGGAGNVDYEQYTWEAPDPFSTGTVTKTMRYWIGKSIGICMTYANLIVHIPEAQGTNYHSVGLFAPLQTALRPTSASGSSNGVYKLTDYDDDNLANVPATVVYKTGGTFITKALSGWIVGKGNGISKKWDNFYEPNYYMTETETANSFFMQNGELTANSEASYV